jgi:ABC-type branched-subunit amino acid transport system substrate-binding protein
LRVVSVLSAAVLAAGLLISHVAGQPLPEAAPCTHRIGMVVSLTGPASRFGQAAAKAVELAFQDLNAAGGAAGCRLAVELRDAQSQAPVAAEQARELIKTRQVPAIIGGVLSMESLAILTGATAKAGVVQISPSALSPALTRLAREGKTRGLFFRVVPSSALQGLAAAKLAVDRGIGSVAVVHVDTDAGAATAAEFGRAFAALGGKVTSVTPYAQNQPSYASEVGRALEGGPGALYLVALPVDGTNIARGWIAQGGPATFLFNDAMKSADLFRDGGPPTFERAFGLSPGKVKTAATAYFAKAFPAMSSFAADAPSADRSYDAAAILGLAIAIAGKAEPAAIREAMRQVAQPGGEVVHAGPEEFRKALKLIGAGKPIRYVGVVGALAFDRNGDVTGPFDTWGVRDGAVVKAGGIAAEEIDAVKAKVGEP